MLVQAKHSSLLGTGSTGLSKLLASWPKLIKWLDAYLAWKRALPRALSNVRTERAGRRRDGGEEREGCIPCGLYLSWSKRIM